VAQTYVGHALGRLPIEVYVSKFAHMRFEPAGLTNDADIRTAKSIVD
jgi:ribonucleoside-diphosphate reductase alpha chain